MSFVIARSGSSSRKRSSAAPRIAPSRSVAARRAPMPISRRRHIGTRRTALAVGNRRIARDLRARAVKIVKEVKDLNEGVADTAAMCNPPFHYTPDGRKIYRIECLK